MNFVQIKQLCVGLTLTTLIACSGSNKIRSVALGLDSGSLPATAVSVLTAVIRPTSSGAPDVLFVSDFQDAKQFDIQGEVPNESNAIVVVATFPQNLIGRAPVLLDQTTSGHAKVLADATFYSDIQNASELKPLVANSPNAAAIESFLDTIHVEVSSDLFVTIGGTVSGLNGSITLSLNATLDLQIDGNGPFSFPQEIASGAPYTVSISQSPSFQHCSLQNGAGVAETADIDNILVTCQNKTWHGPATLSDFFSPVGRDAIESDIAMNAKGEAVVVWRQGNGGFPWIFMSHYSNGTWSDPQTISDFISPIGDAGALRPKVAMNDDGKAVITWQQRHEYFSRIYVGTFENGVWSGPSIDEYISPTPAGTPLGSAKFPQIAMNQNGDYVVTWYQQADDSSYSKIYRYTNINGVENKPTLADYISPDLTPADCTNLSAPELPQAFDPQVSINDRGNALIVWSQKTL